MLPSALSIFWIILVLPTTFAQPIALAIKRPGPDGYLRVQLLAGFMYIGAFISSMCHRLVVWLPQSSFHAPFLSFFILFPSLING